MHTAYLQKVSATYTQNSTIQTQTQAIHDPRRISMNNSASVNADQTS